jgi:glutamate/tyrosine decarboxylase-like PLP-dependent enzyme
MRGIERADSLTWDPHKLMGVPLTCSALLTPHLGALNKTCSYIKSAHYLFHEPGEEYDLGRKSLQCGRRVDALKLWIEWKSCGTAGWRNRVDHYVELAIELETLVKVHPDLELVCERAFTNICLRYTGQMSDDDVINLFNRKLRQKMMQRGNFMVSLANIESKVVLRPVICNPAIDSESLRGFVNEIVDVASTID